MCSNPNILANRYASSLIKEIWSPEGKVVLERELWIAVLKAQKELGIRIPEGTIEAYENCMHIVDLNSIAEREKTTRHDVKARIEEFCSLAGTEHIHKGMTSRDLTENIEQLQTLRSLKLLRLKAIKALQKMANIAQEHKSLIITARTHNVAAQTITLGKRIAMFGEELLRATTLLDNLISHFPFRGIKGAVGTQLDLIALFNEDISKVDALEAKVLKHLEATDSFYATGQIYPRSLDFETVSVLFQLACAPANFCITLRLMAGHGLATEGFSKNQSGSSAMPHKMNARSSERIEGFKNILAGHVTMATSTAGNQWNEGDVSCSVARRVFLPDSIFTIDGLLETFLTVLNQLEFYPQTIEKENRDYLPFLASTQILMESVKKGVGRETAHSLIKKHAVETIQDIRENKTARNNLIDRLATEPGLQLNKVELEKIIEEAKTRVGTSLNAVEKFTATVASWSNKFPDSSKYEPAPIL